MAPSQVKIRIYLVDVPSYFSDFLILWCRVFRCDRSSPKVGQFWRSLRWHHSDSNVTGRLKHVHLKPKIAYSEGLMISENSREKCSINKVMQNIPRICHWGQKIASLVKKVHQQLDTSIALLAILNSRFDQRQNLRNNHPFLPIFCDFWLAFGHSAKSLNLDAFMFNPKIAKSQCVSV